MMNKPLIIKNVLNDKLFIDVNNDLRDHCKWQMKNKSYAGDDHISWVVNPVHDQLTFYKASIIIQLKILRYIKKSIRLCKIHCNGQTRGQAASFHRDFPDDDVWTFVLFTEKNWNTQWGGEFVSQHPKTKEYFYTPYIPNTGALIPSNWQHYGQSPNMSTNKLRTTIAFCYMTSKLFEEYVERGNKSVRRFV